MSRPILSAVSVSLLLLTMLACSGGGGGSGFVGGGSDEDPETFPSRLEEPFDSLRTTRWELELDEDVARPFAQSSRLHFRWSEARSRSIARLVLKKVGFYHAAALEVPALDEDVEVRITIDLQADGGARRASIGIEGGDPRTVEALVEDADGKRIERERTRFTRLDVPPGARDDLVRFEVDAARDAVRFYFADDLLLEYAEPGLRVPPTSRLAIEVQGEAPQETSIERFEAARLGAVRERRVTDVRPNHACPSRVQWLFKLRNARGEVVRLEPDEANELTARIFEEREPIDESETCPVIRTLEALPIQVAIVLDHTLSMETFGGLEPMKESAKALLDVLADSHTFTIWEFHDNQPGGLSQILGPGSTRQQGQDAIDAFEPPLRGFSLCWDTVEAAMLQDFPDDSPASPLRVVVFFSDGVDTSSGSTPDDLIDQAQDRGILLYNLGYGRLTESSRTDLSRIAGETGGIFAEAPTPAEIRPEFEKLIEELSGYIQLAYVTGRITDSRIESMVALEDGELAVQQLIRDRVDGEEISFDDEDQQYDTQTGLLTVDGPTVSAGEAVLFLGAAHVPRQTEQLQLRVRAFQIDEDETEIPLDDAVQVTVLENGPFEGWRESGDLPQIFVVEGPEACFGDFGPLLEVTVDLEGLPAVFTLELTVDNTIYSGLLRFAGSKSEDELDENGNWVTRYLVE